MPCFDPWPWQPQHPGAAIWLRESEERGRGGHKGATENNKKWGGAHPTLCSPSKCSWSGLNRTSSLDPVTRHWRADGTSISSCGGLLKWLTSGYRLKYDIINAWVRLLPSLALEPGYFNKRVANSWSLVSTGWGPPTAGHCISLLFRTGTDGSLYILSSHIFCTIYCLTVSAGIFIAFTFLKHLYSKSWSFFFIIIIFYQPMVNS